MMMIINAQLVRKGDPLRIVQEIKFDILTNGKCTSQKFLENEMHNILWDFEIQTNYPISAKRPKLVIL